MYKQYASMCCHVNFFSILVQFFFWFFVCLVESLYLFFCLNRFHRTIFRPIWSSCVPPFVTQKSQKKEQKFIPIAYDIRLLCKKNFAIFLIFSCDFCHLFWNINIQFLLLKSFVFIFTLFLVRLKMSFFLELLLSDNLLHIEFPCVRLDIFKIKFMVSPLN